VFPPRSVDIHYGNVLHPDTLTAAFQDVEAVVHLVSIIRQRKDQTYDQVNRQGVNNVVAAARESRVKHFVLVSALGAGEDRAYPYLYSKWQGEQEVVNSGLPHTIIRPSIMFGAGDEFLNILAGLMRVSPLALVVGSGRNRLQPIAVEDMARCIALAVDRESLKGKTIEVGGPKQVSYNEIMAIVARALGRRRLRFHVPVWMMYVLAVVAQRIVPRPPVTTDQLRMLAIRNVAEPDVVEKTFGFTPRALEGNIDYVRSVSFLDGIDILTGHMPRRIRDH
jgi:NADH dehydrogenase